MFACLLFLPFSFALAAFLLPSLVQGADCRPSSYESLISCSVSRSAEVRLADKKREASSHLESIARTWQNPELDAEWLQSGEDAEGSATLLFDVNLSGARGAAAKEAQGERQKAEAEGDLSLAQVRIGLVLNFYRLSHLKHEIRLQDESIATFTKILKQYEAKPALSPEQEVSLSVFRMAASGHRLSLAKLAAEQEKLFQEVRASTGLDRADVAPYLPEHKNRWPEISGEGDGGSSPQLRVSAAEALSAQGKKDRADAEAWPSVKIGPALKLAKEGGKSEAFLGLSLSLPLPIFHFNGAGRALETVQADTAKLQYGFQQEKIRRQREELKVTYRSTVATLQGAVSEKSAEEKHGLIERHFFRGLISASLVIEAHRQLIELEESRNQSELAALEALGSLLILDNRFSEAFL